MSNHIYVGSAKERATQYGTEYNLQLEIDDLAQFMADYGYVNKAGRHVLRLKIAKRREVGKYGETHTLEIDTWKPDGTRQGNTRQAPQTPASAPPRASQLVPKMTPEEQDELNQLPIPF